jgi:hypothetical protein
VLRYRLRAKPGDRPSSLAHTGEPLLEPGPCAAGRPGPPFRCQDAVSAVKDGDCEGPPSWMKQFPSDFVYYQSITSRYGVEAGTAVLPGVGAAGAADGCTFWMGDQTKMLQTAELLVPPLLPPTAVANLLNWSPPDARRCAATTMCV